MATKKNSTNKGGVKFLVFLLTCGLLAFALIFFVDFVAVVDTFIGMNYVPSTELAQIIENDSLTTKATRILKASRPELLGPDEFNTKCYSGLEHESSVLGCYADNKIYVYDIDNEKLTGIKETVLAHELLHAVWHRMPIEERQALYADLEKVYAEQFDELGDHMAGYDESQHYDELHSIIGTQIAKEALTPALREHFAEYFSNQDGLITYYNAYNGKFKALEDRAEELSVKIEENRSKIDQMANEYETESLDLVNNIQSFNKRAANGGFVDRASFNAERNELIIRQNRLQEKYQSISNLIEETNTMINEYNDSVVEVGKLYDSVNSRINKATEVIEIED